MNLKACSQLAKLQKYNDYLEEHSAKLEKRVRAAVKIITDKNVLLPNYPKYLQDPLRCYGNEILTAFELSDWHSEKLKGNYD